MNNHFVVFPNGGNGWVIRQKGRNKVLGSANTRRQAESLGRSLARKASGVVTFRSASGQFAGSVTYGN